MFNSWLGLKLSSSFVQETLSFLRLGPSFIILPRSICSHGILILHPANGGHAVILSCALIAITNSLRSVDPKLELIYHLGPVLTSYCYKNKCALAKCKINENDLKRNNRICRIVITWYIFRKTGIIFGGNIPFPSTNLLCRSVF